MVYTNLFTGTQLSNGSSIPAGPGQGIYGSQDVYTPPKTGAVLGTSTSNYTAPTPQPAAPTSGFPMEQAPAAPETNWEEIYAPAFQALDQQKAAYEGSLPGDLANINSQAALEKTGIDNSQKVGEDQINASKLAKAAESKSQEADVRRMSSQLQQGLQSQYGGTTGTGAFLGEILGAGSVKSISGLRQAYVQAGAALDSALFQSKLQYDYQRQSIDQAADEQKNKLQSELKNRLAELSTQRAGLSVDKGLKRADALQTYRDQLNAIEARNTQTKQSLYSNWLSTAQNLSAKKAATEAERNKMEYSANDSYYQTIQKAAEAYSKLSKQIGAPAAAKAVESQYNLASGTLPSSAVMGTVTPTSVKKDEPLTYESLVGTPTN